MDKLYQKNEIRFSLILIAVYIVVFNLAEAFSRYIGIEKSMTFVFTLLYSIWIYRWISKRDLEEKYGLISPGIPAGRLLYYIPLILIATVNLWFGICLNLSVAETVLYVLTMVCVGFIEEIIVRGFIFKALARDNIKIAIAVSSVAFGLGHILNLFNADRMDLLANFLQVCYAMAIGFLFVILFYKTGSLLPSILCHSALNAFSAFANVEAATTEVRIFSATALMIVAGGYSIYLVYSKEEK